MILFIRIAPPHGGSGFFLLGLHPALVLFALVVGEGHLGIVQEGEHGELMLLTRL